MHTRQASMSPTLRTIQLRASAKGGDARPMIWKVLHSMAQCLQSELLKTLVSAEV